jgi:hypothetical protein
VAATSITEITGVCLVHDESDEIVAAEILGQLPGLRLVDPHQRHV